MNTTMNTGAASLLPCPFCGTEQTIEEHPAHEHAFVNLPPHPGSFTIACPTCECGMIHETREGLVAAWNRRATPQADAAPSVEQIILAAKEFAARYAGSSHENRRIAEQEFRAAIAAGGAQEPASAEALALRMLVAGGLVSQEKVDSALKIAARFRARADPAAASNGEQ